MMDTGKERYWEGNYMKGYCFVLLRHLGYNSLAVKDPIRALHSDLLSNLGSVNFLVGDCTHPEKYCQSKASIIFSCVDDSGNWDHSGMIDALARLSSRIPDAYQRASEYGDLHLGDVHLIKVTGGPSHQLEPERGGTSRAN